MAKGVKVLGKRRFMTVVQRFRKHYVFRRKGRAWPAMKSLGYIAFVDGK